MHVAYWNKKSIAKCIIIGDENDKEDGDNDITAGKKCIYKTRIKGDDQKKENCTIVIKENSDIVINGSLTEKKIPDWAADNIGAFAFWHDAGYGSRIEWNHKIIKKRMKNAGKKLKNAKALDINGIVKYYVPTI